SIAHNQLEGSLPATYLSESLFSLDISDNQFSGPLPESMTLLIFLESLGLGGNNLTGPIPPVLGILDNLYYFNTSGSGLTCPADGSECGVKQSNASSFCRLCSSFCSSCMPLK
ncbi:unnamed protein product, partial [Closterium sp. NIES-53]